MNSNHLSKPLSFKLLRDLVQGVPERGVQFHEPGQGAAIDRQKVAGRQQDTSLAVDNKARSRGGNEN